MGKENFCEPVRSGVVFSALSLIPRPVEVSETGKVFELKPEASVVYADDAARQPAEILADQLRRATGFKLPVSPGDNGDVIFKSRRNDALSEEGYGLTVADQIIISASKPAGLFYGAQTLRQLLPPEIYSLGKVSGSWNIPTVEICDMPRFGWRGLMLDVGRYFMPKQDVLKFIDTMASLKLNIFHWHLTDDQGWRIEIKKYPKLTEVGAWRDETLIGHEQDTPQKYDGLRHGGFYTQDEIREVIAYAAERYITIVPEIDMPGHMQAAIAAYPELGCGNEVRVKTEWGVCKNILNPEESTIQFCKDVLTEVMELFPSTYIHIGGDEAVKDQWEASERIQQLLQERGLKDMYEMQSWFIQRIEDFLMANGRRMVGWDEIAEGGLARNATVMWWRGKHLEIARKAVLEGHNIVVATADALYFDHYQAEDKSAEPLAIQGFLPLEAVYNFEPVFEGLDELAVSHILGVQGQLWTEYMPCMKHVEYMGFPRACALAELAWTPTGKKNDVDFFERIKVQELRLSAADVNFRPTDPVAAPGVPKINKEKNDGW